MSVRPNPQTTSDPLSAQVDLLQDGLRRLPKTAAARDVARRFVELLSDSFPGSTLHLHRRSSETGRWENLAGPGGPDPDRFPLPQDDSASGCLLHERPDGLAFVRRLHDGSHFALLLSRTGGPGRYAETDTLRVRLFAHLFEHTLQESLHRKAEKDLAFSLNHRVLQLNSLIDTGIDIARLGRQTSPLQLALERAASLTNASQGFARVTREGTAAQTFSFPEGSPLPDGAADGRSIETRFMFDGATYLFSLQNKESRLGPQPFEETDRLLLDALSRQVQASLENQYLLKQSIEKQKIEQDIAVAASIQRRILPRTLPAIHGYDIAGANIPSITVSGDYYDCIPLPDGRYALIIADVAGKGVSASLLVSTFHAFFKAYLESSVSLLHLAHKLNRVIGQASTDEKFITAFIALLTPETGELEALNAGHTPAYWLRGGSVVEELGVGGVPFGLLDTDFTYQVQEVTLERGDRLLLYTDGVTEARNSDNVLFDTFLPLGTFVAEHTPPTAKAFIDELIARVQLFTGTAPQSDDITVFYLMRD